MLRGEQKRDPGKRSTEEAGWQGHGGGGWGEQGRGSWTRGLGSLWYIDFKINGAAWLAGIPRFLPRAAGRGLGGTCDTVEKKAG